QRIVDRIEDTVSQEVEIFAFWIERGTYIFQDRFSGKMCFATFYVAQFDRRFLRGQSKPISQPAPIRRPIHTAYATIVAAIKHTSSSCLQINYQQFIAMIGNGDHVAG